MGKNNVNYVIEYLVKDEPAYELEGKLVAVSARINNILNLVPEEYRDSAHVSIDKQDNYDTTEVVYSVYYSRPEKKEERERREQADGFRQKCAEDAERALYKKLKEKYESKEA